MTYSLNEFPELDSVASAAVDAAVHVTLHKHGQHHEIGIRYNWRKGSTFLRNAIRVQELGIVARHRYPTGPSRWDFLIPETDSGSELVLASIAHLRMKPGDAVRNAMQWCNEHAPWFDCDTVDFQSPPVLLKADTLGKRIRLTAVERDNLGITTIAAHDQTAQQRDDAKRERKRERDRRRRAAKRLADGAKPRAEYEANAISSAKPWIAEGISRRTWYRRRSNHNASRSVAALT